MKTRNCSRQDAKSAKFGSCHFDRREKSFLVPSDSLGMTGLSPSLCGPFDLAQDMLCAFAGDIPIFGFAVSPGWASVVKILHTKPGRTEFVGADKEARLQEEVKP